MEFIFLFRPGIAYSQVLPEFPTTTLISTCGVGIKSTRKSDFEFNLIWFTCMSFLACMRHRYICPPHVCLMPEEVRRWYYIPWNLYVWLALKHRLVPGKRSWIIFPLSHFSSSPSFLGFGNIAKEEVENI